MSSTPHFANCDTKKPDGLYVQFERVILDDECGDRPDKRQDGYWPSQDVNDAGYCGLVTDVEFRRQYAEAKARMDSFDRGTWNYVGVRARALCLLVRNSVGMYFNLDSAGLWGIESDAGSYLDEVYVEQIEELRDMIRDLQQATLFLELPAVS